MPDKVSESGAIRNLWAWSGPGALLYCENEQVTNNPPPHFILLLAREALGLFNQHGQPAYQYFFDAKLPNWVDYDLLGNYHTSELSLVFDNEWPPIVHDFNKDEKALSASFRLYWSNMARFGDPNHNLGPNQAVWPV